MTEYELDELRDEQQAIADMAGMVNFEHFLEFKHNAIHGMERFGSPFVRILGAALANADHANAVKIMRVWRPEVTEHEILWRMLEAKKKAMNILIEDSDFDPRN